jgi:hypothetical protein
MLNRLLQRLKGTAGAPTSAVFVEPVARDSGEIENIVPGSVLSLGNGRTIAFGERARVDIAVAAFLRERGQVS